MEEWNIKVNKKINVWGGGRLNSIDLVKGLAIVLMVMGHAGFPYTHYLYLFHMAVFFIASGFCWNENHSSSIKDCVSYIGKKIKTLYVPYIVCNGTFLILNNLFIKVNILATDTSTFRLVSEIYNYGSATQLSAGDTIREMLKILVFMGGTQLGGATWFLRALFGVSVGHCIWMWCLHRLSKQYKNIILSGTFLFCCAGYELYRCGLFPIESKVLFQIVLGYIAYLLGVLFRSVEIYLKRGLIKSSYTTAIISFFILLFFNSFASINVDRAAVTNIMVYVISSVMGWILVYSIAEIMGKIRCLSIPVIYIGQNTLPIVMLHFLSFKIVNFVVCLTMDLPMSIVAFFPSIKINKWLWIFYTAVGVVVPLICNELYKSVKNVLRK